MTVFDHDAADRARAENPALTVFDTGQMLEPELDMASDLVKTGLVEFTNDESAPVLTVMAQPSVTDGDTTLVRIETPGGGRFKVALNDQEIWVGDVDANREPDFDAIADAVIVNQHGEQFAGGQSDTPWIGMVRLAAIEAAKAGHSQHTRLIYNSAHTDVPTVASLDGTVDEADWIGVGHTLDADEVTYIRSLVIPGQSIN